ncbi:MAG: hypothetical protein C4290_15450 [Chloroflexota bacterium]
MIPCRTSKAGRCANRVSTEIGDTTGGRDHCTFEPPATIRHAEIEHEAWSSESLGEGSSGHVRHGVIGESLHT